MSMLNERALMGGHARLPKEYQEVEWIGFYTDPNYNSQGNRINTQIRTTDNVQIVVDFGTESPDFNTLESWLFGLESTSTPDQRFGFGICSGKAHYGSINGEITTDISLFDGRHTVIYNDINGMTFLDDEQISTTDNPADTSYNNLIYIGRRGRNNRNYGGVIYECKIIDNATGEILRHYIPCYVKATNIPTFYDIANNSEAIIINTSVNSWLVAGPKV